MSLVIFAIDSFLWRMLLSLQSCDGMEFDMLLFYGATIVKKKPENMLPTGGYGMR